MMIFDKGTIVASVSAGLPEIVAVSPFYGALLVTLVVCITIGLTVFTAKVVGCSLPLLAKRLGFDPTVMANPFITTIVDALSLVVYFKVAALMLGI
jgi:Mg/Co/Ni transporter MgtE